MTMEFASGDSLTTPARRDAMARLKVMGWPDSRNETWKNTQLSPWLDRLHVTAPHVTDNAQALAVQSAGHLGGVRLVFVNGRLDTNLSRHADVPGVHMGSLAQAASTKAAWLNAHLGSTGVHTDSALGALNTALWEDGALIHVSANQTLSAPIEIIHVASGAQRSCIRPRILVVADTGSDVTVLETFVGDAASQHVTCAVSEVIVGDNARVQYYVLQEESDACGHVGIMSARLGRDAHLTASVLNGGGKLARREVRVCLAAPGSTCDLSGLSLGRGEQHADAQVLVEHQSPHCNSNQTFTSIVDERAASVFSGKVMVAPHAIKTDARQLNKNLLLSAFATANTRPQLEILADDVKCSHGATVGQLDDEALFYLQSRGLDLPQARQLLTYAFATALLTALPNAAVRALFSERARHWLGLGAVGELS